MPIYTGGYTLLTSSRFSGWAGTHTTHSQAHTKTGHACTRTPAVGKLLVFGVTSLRPYHLPVSPTLYLDVTGYHYCRSAFVHEVP